MLSVALHASTAAQKAVKKPVLRRITRQYDAEGNETVTVDYFRDASSIRGYKVRIGLEEEVAVGCVCTAVPCPWCPCCTVALLRCCTVALCHSAPSPLLFLSLSHSVLLLREHCVVLLSCHAVTPSRCSLSSCRPACLQFSHVPCPSAEQVLVMVVPLVLVVAGLAS